METISSVRSTSAVGSFWARFSPRLLAVVAVVAAMGTDDGLRAGPPPGARGISGNGFNFIGVDRPSGSNVVTVALPPSGSLPLLQLNGGDFVNLSELSATISGSNLFYGNLISIRADVVLTTHGLEGSANPNVPTEAIDLTVYVAPVDGSSSPNSPSQSSSAFQLGGTNTVDVVTASPTRLYWDSPALQPTDLNNYSDEFDRTIDVSGLGVSLASGGPLAVWLGNAYTEGNSFGIWTGTLEFTFASSGGSGVPDASRTALLLAPGTLLLLGLAGRSRRRS